ncbi:SHOCT domain-containing protein [Nocardia sp. 2]|uniref:SHOCT domain-containing protein n=1 Tax=Nocardia acididurans TaxID=2802282 RepID=A0ABS1MI98_9NOCA|nr:SHOCT domain-containing protein [Nocardia acididurans]MBL1080309.1 SHOCT domain-containing protein [Nocardia acididurans]
MATVAVLVGLGSALVLFAGRDAAEAQPIPCEQWQQMHPGWPCADVPTYNPQPTQPPNTGAPAPIIPSLLNPPTQQGGGPGAGALTPPPLQGPPNMNNPIVPVPGYVPPVLPGNEQPAAPQAPGSPETAGPQSIPPDASVTQAPFSTQPGQIAPNDDLVAQLERAARLHDQGVLSDQEFAELKQRLLQSGPAIPAPTQSQPEGAAVQPQNGEADPRLPLLAIIGAVAFAAAGAGPRSSRQTEPAAPIAGSAPATGPASPRDLAGALLHNANSTPSLTLDGGGGRSPSSPSSTTSGPTFSGAQTSMNPNAQSQSPGSTQPGTRWFDGVVEDKTPGGPSSNTVPLKDSPVPLLGLTPDAGGQTPSGPTSSSPSGTTTGPTTSGAQPSTNPNPQSQSPGSTQPGTRWFDGIVEDKTPDGPSSNTVPLKDSPVPLLGLTPDVGGDRPSSDPRPGTHWFDSLIEDRSPDGQTVPLDQSPVPLPFLSPDMRGPSHTDGGDSIPETPDLGKDNPVSPYALAGALAVGGLGASETGFGVPLGLALLAVAGGLALYGMAQDRGDGRDALGQYADGNPGTSGKAQEQAALDEYARDSGEEVIRDQIKASVPGVEQGRYYDGLVENPDGTYTGLEVKSGTASKNANQREFDGAVSPDNPATATLNGKTIEITKVIDLKG